MSPFGLLVPARCLACRAVGPPPLCPDCDTTLEPDGVLHHLTPGAATLAAWAYTGALPDASKAVKTGGLREGAQALAGRIAEGRRRTTPLRDARVRAETARVESESRILVTQRRRDPRIRYRERSSFRVLGAWDRGTSLLFYAA